MANCLVLACKNHNTNIDVFEKQQRDGHWCEQIQEKATPVWLKINQYSEYEPQLLKERNQKSWYHIAVYLFVVVYYPLAKLCPLPPCYIWKTKPRQCASKGSKSRHQNTNPFPSRDGIDPSSDHTGGNVNHFIRDYVSCASLYQS